MSGPIEFGDTPPTFASTPIPENPEPNDFDVPFYEELR